MNNDHCFLEVFHNEGGRRAGHGSPATTSDHELEDVRNEDSETVACVPRGGAGDGQGRGHQCEI